MSTIEGPRHRNRKKELPEGSARRLSKKNTSNVGKTESPIKSEICRHVSDPEVHSLENVNSFSEKVSFMQMSRATPGSLLGKF